MNNYNAHTGHFDPYQGFVESGKDLNLRFGFQLGSLNLLIKDAGRCEVITKKTIYPLPNTSRWISGLINNRGELTPVFDLKSRIFGEHEPGERTRELIVLGTSSDAFAVFIDGLPLTIDLDADELTVINTVPTNTPELIKQYSTRVYRLESQIWYEIDYHQLITDITSEYHSKTDK